MIDRSPGSREERTAAKVDLPSYREGFADALRWVLDVFNLDMEDELELQRVLDGGKCEGERV